MSMSDHKAKDAAMAAYMKKYPGSFPDSVMRPHRGVGHEDRALAATLARSFQATTKWDFGMLGGVLAARLGLGNANVPIGLLTERRSYGAH